MSVNSIKSLGALTKDAAELEHVGTGIDRKVSIVVNLGTNAAEHLKVRAVLAQHAEFPLTEIELYEELVNEVCTEETSQRVIIRVLTISDDQLEIGEISRYMAALILVGVTPETILQRF